MNRALTFQPLISIPWGDKGDEIPLTLAEYPHFAFVSPEQMRKVPAPVRIRLSANGNVHVLADAPLRTKNAPVFIQHFDAEGKSLGKTALPFPDLSDTKDVFILDYSLDADGNCYLLERINATQPAQSANRLRKLNSVGAQQWSRTGPVTNDRFDFHELSGTFEKLLTDGRSHLYLPATIHAGAIAEIDRGTGNVAHVYTPDKFSGQAFMNESATAVYVLYFSDLNRRGLGFFNLEDGRVSTVVGGVELYGWLLYPMGVDSASNVYAWNDFAVSRISPDGRISVIAEFDNIVVRSSDQVIFTSHTRLIDEHTTLVQVISHGAAAASASQELRVPEKLTAGLGATWKLIHVDELERRYVFGGEEPGQAGTLLVYSKDGELETTASPPRDLPTLESRLEDYSFWQVDSSGRIYLPLTDAQGFKVVRLNTGESPRG